MPLVLEFDVRPGAGLLTGEVCSGEGGAKDFVAFFVFYDEAGDPISPPYEGLGLSKRGAYRYIRGSVEGRSAPFSLYVKAPAGARRLVVELSSWNFEGRMAFSTFPDISGAMVRSRAGKTTANKSQIVDEGSFSPGSVVDLQIEIARRASDAEKAYIVAVRQFDKAGSLVPGRIPGLSHSEAVGPYRYVDLRDGDEAAVVRVAFDGLPSAVRYDVRVQSWRSTGPPDARLLKKTHRPDAATQFEQAQSLLDAFLHGTLHSGSLGIVVITATTKPIDAENRLNRPQIAAKTLARLGYRVVYVYHRFNAQEELCAQQVPDVLQLPVDVFSRLYSRIAAFDGLDARIAIFSMPDDVACRSIGVFKFYGWRTVYEVRDDWEEFAAAGVGKWYRPAFERFLTRTSDDIVCVSPPLLQKMEMFAGGGRTGFLSPNATFKEFVAAAAPYRSARAGAGSRNAAPVIGYFGHLTEAWFDFNLIASAARLEPSWRFELIGFGAPDLTLPANVRVLSAVPTLDLPGLTSHWDVAMIPFRQSPLARAVDPIKVYDYLSLNLPVVSSEMGQLSKLAGCYIYEDLASFLHCCRSAYDDIASRPVAIPFDADENVWEHRIETLLSSIMNRRQMTRGAR